jgi:hypothetical protein
MRPKCAEGFERLQRLYFQSNDILVDIGNPLRDPRVRPLAVILLYDRFARLALQKDPRKQRLARRIKGGISVAFARF